MSTADPLHRNRPEPKEGRVLIVDDDDAVRQAFVRNLQVEGFLVVSAASGAAGLAALRSDPSIVLVLLDLMMSEMDGWAFRDEQLRDSHLATVPTIVMTGSALHKIEHEQLKATDYLLKPVGREHLVSVVANYCHRMKPAS